MLNSKHVKVWFLISGFLAAGVPLFARQPVPDFEPVWIRVGDSYGKVDKERKSASVEVAEFSPDQTLIAAGAKRGGNVTCWTIDGRKLWDKKHKADPEREVEVITWTRDSEFVLSGGENHRVNVWSAVKGVKIKTLMHRASIDGMRMSYDGSLLACGTEAGEIVIWDTSHPDPNKWPDDPLAVLYQGPDKDRPHGGQEHSDVNSIDWTKDDRFLVTAGRNAVVKRWDVGRLLKDEPALVQSYEGFQSSIKSVRISPDQKFIAAGGQNSPDAAFYVWDYESGNILAHINVPHFNKIEAVEFTPDGRFLITGGNEGSGYNSRKGIPEYRYMQGFGEIRVYSTEDNFALVHREHVFRQEYFQFTQDGARLLSSHEDGTLRFWRVEYTNKPINVFANINIDSKRYFYPSKQFVQGVKLYRDSERVITEIPDYLQNHWFIQPDLADHDEKDQDFLSFDLRVPSTLYVAYDPRAERHPNWLLDWTAIHEVVEIDTSDGQNDVDHLRLFANYFPAGRVELGGNRTRPARGAELNYIIIGRKGRHIIRFK
ncbi:MAG: hypothetical protein U5R06_10910 [candidate division KSB1 bacterium]|nr:hypothetical protein [candidate division KSB1 bacterium]